MTAREFRCRECGHPFRTADRGWARDADLMCPACGSSDVSILVTLPRHESVRMVATEERASAGAGR